MQFSLKSEVPGFLRCKLLGPVPSEDVSPLSFSIEECPQVESVRIYPRIGEVSLRYVRVEGARQQVLSYLSGIDRAAIENARTQAAGLAATRSGVLLEEIAWIVGAHYFTRWFLPAPLRALWTLFRFRSFLQEGVSSLAKARLDVPVLDMAAIGVSLLKRDFATAGSTMFLLSLGEALERYTKSRSEADLIQSLLQVADNVKLVQGNEETTVAVSSLQPGDLIVMRNGMPICVDGVVERGTALVNQASLTGEPMPVERCAGDDVFAGTAVEEGEIFVRVKAGMESSKLRSIVTLVERTDQHKAAIQTRRELLADRIVPWNLLLAAAAGLFTGSLTKASAALMVDYSCALKLTGSIAVLSAMSQSAKLGFTVKGSRHFEEMALADTIVFDKTGTLTKAIPQVGCVVPLKGWEPDEVLRLAACLEEHFPHPVACAVVAAAEARDLHHRERHGQVEYIVAHGIVSSLDGARVAIGSAHFVFEDEAASAEQEHLDLIYSQTTGMSVLYLAVDGELIGALGINDPLRSEARRVVSDLRGLGFKRVIMLTGDSERAAAEIAAAAGIGEYRANLLPDEKYQIVEELKQQGARVVMVGDGVNDSPSLSLANVGIAMASGTAIAREVADVTMNEASLDSVVRFRILSRELMRRMNRDFTAVMGINSAVLASGLAGFIAPEVSGLIHNGSTVALSLNSSRKYNAGQEI